MGPSFLLSSFPSFLLSFFSFFPSFLLSFFPPFLLVFEFFFFSRRMTHGYGIDFYFLFVTFFLCKFSLSLLQNCTILWPKDELIDLTVCLYSFLLRTCFIL